MASLRNDLHVSVAEVGYQDRWQRCELGVAIAAGTATGARKVAQQVEQIVWRDPRIEVVSCTVSLVSPEE